MFNNFKDNQKRYWPATVTKIVALAILIPLVVLFVLLLVVVWVLGGVW